MPGWGGCEACSSLLGAQTALSGSLGAACEPAWPCCAGALPGLSSPPPVPPILKLPVCPYLPSCLPPGAQVSDRALPWAPLVQFLGPSWLFVLEVAEAVLVSDWLVQ